MIFGSCFYLRHPKKTEFEQLLELMNHPDSRGDFLGTEIFLPGAFEKTMEQQQHTREEREQFLIIGPDEQILGRIFHFKTVPYFHSREIGYSIFSPAMRGRGIVSEALCLLRNYLFETTLVNRLEIHLQEGNLGSEKVALKAGFQYEGLARGAVFARGHFRDVKMFGLVRSEWQTILSNQAGAKH